jgi:hypothetical protein
MNYLNTAPRRVAVLTALILAATFGALSAEIRHRADIQIRDLETDPPELKRTRKELNETDKKYPAIQKIIDENWD